MMLFLALKELGTIIMSDGMTDIKRDDDRMVAYANYIEALASYLIDPKDLKLKKNVSEAAAASDIIKRGYFTGPSNLCVGLERVLCDVGNLKIALDVIGYNIVAEDDSEN